MDSSSSPMGAVAILFVLVFCLAIYVFYCYCLKRIVEKCGGEPGALIWIPVLQMIPMFQCAKMNPWLTLLTLVPLANLVVVIMLWINLLKVLGRDPLMVLVVLLLGFIYIPYLAFSSEIKAAPAVA